MDQALDIKKAPLNSLCTFPSTHRDMFFQTTPYSKSPRRQTSTLKRKCEGVGMGERLKIPPNFYHRVSFLAYATEHDIYRKKGGLKRRIG